MEVHTIEWHEEVYNNWKQSLDIHEERTLKELERIKEDRKRLDFYKFQIDEAKKLGKDNFDRDKFRKKRLKEKENEMQISTNE